MKSQIWLSKVTKITILAILETMNLDFGESVYFFALKIAKRLILSLE